MNPIPEQREEWWDEYQEYCMSGYDDNYFDDDEV